MRKNKDIFVQEFKSRPFDTIIRVVSLLILALGAYITIRLIPIYQNINKIVSDVNALQVNVGELQLASKSNQDIMIELKGLSAQIQDVQDRVERIDNRLDKHMGI